jgi:glycosyltransferase involved in cell wall biosynthesis
MINRALFLVFHGFNESNGISKKIHYQIKALKDCGLDTRLCHYEITEEGHRGWMIDGKMIADFGTGSVAKIRKRMCYDAIVDYVIKEDINLIYIRSYHNANPFTIKMVKELREAGVKTVLEIPTYPYDQEYVTMRMKMDLMVDKCYRKKLAKQIDAIVTFSNEENIFGCRTIRISNGIDFDAIALKKRVNDISKEMHLIAVAEIHYWHGFDRVIAGLGKYYETNPDYKVFLHIVGECFGERERKEIEGAISAGKVNNYMIMNGAKHGEELDELFEEADFAIGSLGRHRSGISKIKTLKNREYAARGIPFVYSETDEDFDKMPYVMKATADESPIDIEGIINFRNNLTIKPIEIRESVKNLSWTEQMKKVLSEI